MSDKIIFEVKVEGNDVPCYGIIHISNIRHEDGSPVKIQNTLDIAFKSPAEVTSGRDFNVKSDPLIDFTAVPITSTEIDSSTFDIVAKLSVPKAYTINDSLTIQISVDGDLTGDAKRYTESVVITQDGK
ncbi:hypothetical protein V501_00615 [Pseudogymnoascus sp. VKM F-4519 (FW-2642)]|nr:hypothetical protein V501_00615 [Pseudogymnoascus sp. VKM F-4519 (FW-2642)]